MDDVNKGDLTHKFATIIDQHVSSYEKALHHCSMSQEHLRQAENHGRGAGYDYFLTTIRGFDQAKKALKINVWRSLIDKTKLSVLMDSKTRSEMNDELERNAPDITHDNVEKILLDLFERKNEILADSLLNVFNGLSCHFVSNDKLKLTNKRIIIENVVGTTGRYSNSDKLTDLDRIFHFIDGRAFDAKNYTYTLGHIVSKLSNSFYKDQLISNIAEIKKAEPTRLLQLVSEDELDTDYFFIRGFMNGNVHIYFKRKDLIDQCNRLIAYHNKSKLGVFRA